MKWENRAVVEGNPEEIVQRYGKDLLSDPRYLRLGKLKQHRTSTTLAHSYSVAVMAVALAIKKRWEIDVQSLVRGSLLHDYYLYEYTKTHTKGHFRHHGETAMNNAIRDFGLNALEKDMIYCHMWPFRFLNRPHSKEGFLLWKADKRVAMKEFLHPKKAEKGNENGSK